MKPIERAIIDDLVNYMRKFSFLTSQEPAYVRNLNSDKLADYLAQNVSERANSAVRHFTEDTFGPAGRVINLATKQRRTRNNAIHAAFSHVDTQEALKRFYEIAGFDIEQLDVLANHLAEIATGWPDVPGYHEKSSTEPDTADLVCATKPLKDVAVGFLHERSFDVSDKLTPLLWDAGIPLSADYIFSEAVEAHARTVRASRSNDTASIEDDQRRLSQLLESEFLFGISKNFFKHFERKVENDDAYRSALEMNAMRRLYPSLGSDADVNVDAFLEEASSAMPAPG